MNVEELFAQAHIVEQQIVELQPLQAEDLILDIRGGGKGIIGKRVHLYVRARAGRGSDEVERERQTI